MSLKTGGFTNPLEGAKKSMEGFRAAAEKISGVLAAVGVSFAAFKSAEGFTEGLKGIVEFGNQLQAQSRITGERVSDLVTLRQAYKEAGLDAESVAPNLISLQRALGGVNDEGQPTKDIFKQLHLNMQQLQGETAVQQFDAMAKAIGNLGTQSAKTAAITAMFGRGGAQMEAVFANPQAIEEARKSVGNFGQVMEQNAATFSKLSSAFDLLGQQSQRFFAGFGGQIGPTLDKLLDKINGIDLTKLGTQIGQAVQTLYAAFQQGKLTEIVGLSLQAGIESGLSILGDAHAWEALGDMIKATFEKAGQVLMDAFKKPIAYLQAEMDITMSKLPGGVNQQLQKQIDAATKEAQSIEQKLVTQSGNNGEAGPTLMGNGPQAKLSAKDQARLDDLNKYINDLEAQKDATLDQRAAAYQANPEFMDQAAARKGQEAAKDASEALKRFNQAMAATGKASAETMKKLQDLWIGVKAAMPKELVSPSDKPATGTGRIDATKLDLGRDRGRDDSMDRFAKVGLFVGGAGGPGADYARRTADNTSKLCDKVDALKESLKPQWHETHMQSLKF